MEVLHWMAKETPVNNDGTEIPDYAYQAMESCLLPIIQKYFESEEGKQAFNEWKTKQLDGKSRPTSKPQKWRGGVTDHLAIFICFSIRCAMTYARTGFIVLSLWSTSHITALWGSATKRKKRSSPR